MSVKGQERSWQVIHDRQLFNSSQARLTSPLDLRRINGQREVWPALEQGLERASAFAAGELVTETGVDDRSQGDWEGRAPIEVDSLGPLIRRWIQICGREHGHDLVSRFKPHAAKYRVLSNKARLGELHRRDEAEESFDRETCAPPIFHQPISKSPISQQFEHRPADEMRGRLVPGN